VADEEDVEDRDPAHAARPAEFIGRTYRAPADRWCFFDLGLGFGFGFARSTLKL
jgi:hypothetical protein